MKQAVIFDLDGTLLDSIADLAAAINEILKRHGYETLPLETVNSYVGNGLSMLLKRALKDERQRKAPVEGDEFQAYLKELITYYRAHCMDQTVPYKGIETMLLALKEKGIKTAIVTNKNTLAATELWEHFFKDVITVVVGEDEAHGIKKKPAPDMVLEALRKLEVSASDACYVGDSEVDVETARNCKMEGAFVLWGFRSKEELKKAGANVLVETPEELKEVVTHD
ncbi:phosphoglycolate phosphatase [Lachnospiraceae bacterium XBB1006]|nr:phosphoglycolate phosphatase [Lachnospiraceae bacterium XBB1006]